MSPHKKTKKPAGYKKDKIVRNDQALVVLPSRKQKEKERDKKKEIDQLFKDLAP